MSASQLVQKLRRPLAELAELAEDLPAPRVHLPALTGTATTLGKAAAIAEKAPVALGILGRLFPKWRPAADTLLRFRGVRLSTPLLRDLGRTIHSALGGRLLTNLSGQETAELADVVRTRMLALSGAVDRDLLKAAQRRAAAALKQGGATTQLITTPVRDGIWVFVVPSSKPDIVVAEAFAPLKSGAAVPPRPAVPGAPRPRWVVDDTGTIAKTAPPIPATPREVPSGLPPQALEEGPAVLLEVLTNAERRRLGLSSGTISGEPIKFTGDIPEKMRRAFGGGIRTVAYRTTEAGRIRVTITGRTRMVVARLADENILPLPSKVFGAKSGMKRLHAYGPILGDTIAAGIAYGPAELNNAMQELESIMRARGLNGVNALDVTVTATIDLRKVNGVDYPFLRKATYEWTHGGTPFTFSVGIDEAERVFLMRGLGEGDNIWRSASQRRTGQ